MAREIENALKSLQEARAHSVEVSNLFQVRCEQFIKDCRTFMGNHPTLTSIQIGDNRQGVHVPLCGKATWYGITTAAILEGYEKQLLELINKEIERVIDNYKRLC